MPIYELGSWSNYFVTFEVDGIYKAKKNIYLCTNQFLEESYDDIFCLKGFKKINNQSQKLYIKPDNENHNLIIKNIIDNPNYWEDNTVSKINLDTDITNEDKLFEIMNKRFIEQIKKNKK